MDPFAGGGSIPLEALRVGADAYGSDLNPVAVLLNKVMLEYVPKYGQTLADDIRKWGQWVQIEAERELAEYYPKDPGGATPISYLWARTITCEGPGCGAEVPLLRSLWLAKRAGHSAALHLIPKPVEKRVDFEILHNAKATDVKEGTVRRGSVSCPCCGYTTPVASVRKQLKTRHGGADDARMFCVVTTKTTEQGRFYRLPTHRDLDAVRRAKDELERRKREWTGELSLVPDEPTTQYHTFVNRGPIYGMTTWGDYFTSRQLLALTTFVRLTKAYKDSNVSEKSKSDISAIQTCLALAIDRCANQFTSLSKWNSGREMVDGVFARQAIPMLWDFGEISPFSGDGYWNGAINWIGQVIEKNVLEGCGCSKVASAINHPLKTDSAQGFITDPPYYYSVQYADLSDFFYVWLHRSLGNVHPDLFHENLTPKTDEIIVQSPGHEFAADGKNRQFYESRMQLAMAEGRRILCPDGIGVIVFANTSTAGWETLLQSLVESGWVITGSWPIDTEMASRVLAQNRSVLASSIHLVCRPRDNPNGSFRSNDVGDWRDVLHELPIRIHEWMPRLAAEGVVGADAIFACLGPALEIYSRYSRVEKPNGEQVLLREYLEKVWEAVAREALTVIFHDADTSGFEEDARLTAMWLWTLSAGGDQNGAVTVSGIDDDDIGDDEKSAGQKNWCKGWVHT